MKYQITILISPEEADSRTIKWEAELLNHNDAIAEALLKLRQMEEEEDGKLPKATDGLAVIVQPLPESEDDQPLYLGWILQKEQRRETRDPYGKIEHSMLNARAGKQSNGAAQREANQRWKKEHPEFALEYLLELQKLERQALELQIGRDALPEGRPRSNT